MPGLFAGRVFRPGV